MCPRSWPRSWQAAGLGLASTGVPERRSAEAAAMQVGGAARARAAAGVAETGATVARTMVRVQRTPVFPVLGHTRLVPSHLGLPVTPCRLLRRPALLRPPSELHRLRRSAHAALCAGDVSIQCDFLPADCWRYGARLPVAPASIRAAAPTRGWRLGLLLLAADLAPAGGGLIVTAAHSPLPPPSLPPPLPAAIIRSSSWVSVGSGNKRQQRLCCGIATN